MLNNEAIEEYKKIYKTQFGVSLNDIEALEKSSSLLRLFEVLTTSNSNKLDLVEIKRHHK